MKVNYSGPAGVHPELGLLVTGLNELPETAALTEALVAGVVTTATAANRQGLEVPGPARTGPTNVMGHPAEHVDVTPRGGPPRENR